MMIHKQALLLCYDMTRYELHWKAFRLQGIGLFTDFGMPMRN